MPSAPADSSPSRSDTSSLPDIPSGEILISTPKNSPVVIPPAEYKPFAAQIITEEQVSSREGPVSYKHKEPDSPDYSAKHESARKKARDNTFKAAVGMANYYNKAKCTQNNAFKEEDKVSFQVPKIDRCSTDLQRIPGIILNVSGGHKIQFYQVATSVGIINTKFCSGDLTVFNGHVDPSEESLFHSEKQHAT